MKTVDEIALGIVQKWREGTYHNDCQANAALQVAIIEALKTQERATRYACAETVTKVISASLADGGCFPLGIVSGIEHAIMNAKAI